MGSAALRKCAICTESNDYLDVDRNTTRKTTNSESDNDEESSLRRNSQLIYYYDPEKELIFEIEEEIGEEVP